MTRETLSGLLTVPSFRQQFPQIDTVGNPSDCHVAIIQGKFETVSQAQVPLGEIESLTLHPKTGCNRGGMERRLHNQCDFGPVVWGHYRPSEDDPDGSHVLDNRRDSAGVFIQSRSADRW